MSRRAPLLALGLAALAAGCATGRATRASALPPPATESRAGTREPGAGPAPASPAPAAAAAGGVAAPARPPRARHVPRDQAVRRAIDAAAGQVGRRDIVVAGVRYGDACASLVRAALAEAGAPAPEGADAAALLELARSRGKVRRFAPAPGDLVFLSDRPGGPAEHVGIVQSVAPDGTALVLHHTERGVSRLRVNTAQPWKARTETGKALNDVLIVGAGRVTAGRLLVAYATVF